MQLPEKDCLPALPMNDSKCTEDEFDCGDGVCIHGLQLCDNKFDCRNGADELQWYVTPDVNVMERMEPLGTTPKFWNLFLMRACNIF